MNISKNEYFKLCKEFDFNDKGKNPMANGPKIMEMATKIMEKNHDDPVAIFYVNYMTAIVQFTKNNLPVKDEKEYISNGEKALNLVMLEAEYYSGLELPIMICANVMNMAVLFQTMYEDKITSTLDGLKKKLADMKMACEFAKTATDKSKHAEIDKLMKEGCAEVEKAIADSVGMLGPVRDEEIEVYEAALEVNIILIDDVINNTESYGIEDVNKISELMKGNLSFLQTLIYSISKSDGISLQQVEENYKSVNTYKTKVEDIIFKIEKEIQDRKKYLKELEKKRKQARDEYWKLHKDRYDELKNEIDKLENINIEHNKRINSLNTVLQELSLKANKKTKSEEIADSIKNEIEYKEKELSKLSFIHFKRKKELSEELISLKDRYEKENVLAIDERKMLEDELNKTRKESNDEIVKLKEEIKNNDSKVKKNKKELEKDR